MRGLLQRWPLPGNPKYASAPPAAVKVACPVRIASTRERGLGASAAITSARTRSGQLRQDDRGLIPSGVTRAAAELRRQHLGPAPLRQIREHNNRFIVVAAGRGAAQRAHVRRIVMRVRDGRDTYSVSREALHDSGHDHRRRLRGHVQRAGELRRERRGRDRQRGQQQHVKPARGQPGGAGARHGFRDDYVGAERQMRPMRLDGAGRKHRHGPRRRQVAHRRPRQRRQ